MNLPVGTAERHPARLWPPELRELLRERVAGALAEEAVQRPEPHRPQELHGPTRRRGKVRGHQELVHREGSGGTAPTLRPPEAQRPALVRPQRIAEHLQQPGAAAPGRPVDPYELRLELLVVERETGRGGVSGSPYGHP